jgi:hypothetical protein
MKHERKTGLIAMSIFGPMLVAMEYAEFHWVNETTGFVGVFGGVILSLAFLMGLVQFITGEVS